MQRPSLWLWLLVLVQVAIPASYYLLRNDRDDERFAWRMFSAVRLTRCEVSAWDQRSQGETRIQLNEVLHASWIRSLERGRQRVIDAFLASRCGDPAVRASVLERACTAPSGEKLPQRRYRQRCDRETGAL